MINCLATFWKWKSFFSRNTCYAKVVKELWNEYHWIEMLKQQWKKKSISSKFGNFWEWLAHTGDSFTMFCMDGLLKVQAFFFRNRCPSECYFDVATNHYQFLFRYIHFPLRRFTLHMQVEINLRQWLLYTWKKSSGWEWQVWHGKWTVVDCSSRET